MGLQADVARILGRLRLSAPWSLQIAGEMELVHDLPVKGHRYIGAVDLNFIVVPFPNRTRGRREIRPLQSHPISRRSSSPVCPNTLIYIGFSRVTAVAGLVHLRLNEFEQVVWRLPRRDAALIRDPCDFSSDVGRDFADAWQSRIEATLREVCFSHELRERVRRTHEHFVRNALRSTRDGAQPHTRENVRVVPLPWHKGSAS